MKFMSMEKPTDLVPIAPTGSSLAQRRPDLVEEAEAFAKKSVSDATRKAVQFDWGVFSAWCTAQGVEAMPASVDTAVAFMTEMARTKRPSTLVRYGATIGRLHKLAGYESPFADARVRTVMAGIRRTLGTAQVQKAALTFDIAATETGCSAAAVRDKAIRLLGVGTSFRGAELCSLDLSDLTFVDEGVLVRLRRGKTDQEGEGRTVAVPATPYAPVECPVSALKKWLELRGDWAGALFVGMKRDHLPGRRRTTRGTIGLIIKAAVAKAGLDPNAFGSHSMRSGYVTEARRAGRSWSEIQVQTGHARIESVKRYDRDGRIDPWRDSRVADVFRASHERRQTKINNQIDKDKDDP